MPLGPGQTAGPAAARRRAFEHAFFGVVPVLWMLYLLSVFAARDAVAFDFHHYYWPAGDRVLHGLTPYLHGPWYPSEVPVGFVYPAPASVVFAAIAAIPRAVGDILFTVLALAAPLLTLRLLDVRDWRVYGVVLLWPPITFGVQTANLSMLFTLAVAAMWCYRDRPRVVGVIFGVVVAMKLFLFPLALFFLATRRLSALAYGILTAFLLTSASWLIVGLDEVPRYRATVEKFTGLREDQGYSVIGLVDRLGGGRPLGYAIALTLAGSAALACVVLAWRGQESAAFILALSAALLVTPIMWMHYFVFLLIPIGLRSPMLGVLWALPLLFYPLGEVHPSNLQAAAGLMVGALVIAAALRKSDRWRAFPVARTARADMPG